MAVERIDGVRNAEFSYPEGTGVLTYDTTATSIDAILRELERTTGFTAVVREDP